MYAFVFDFDGPLFDGRKIAQQALNETLTHFEEQYGHPQIAFTNLALLDPRHLIAVMYAERALDRKDLAKVERYYRERLEEKEQHAVANSEVKQILKIMKERSVRMAVFSARHTSQVEDLLSRMSLRDCFDVVVGCDLTPHPKPAPDGLEYIAKELGLKSDQLVLIGDSNVDHQAARTTGTVYYHVGWTGEPASSAHFGADAVIPQRSDLYEVMESATRTISAVAPALPDDLKEAIRSGEFSFYAGAGVSVRSGIGAWVNHYEPVLRELHAGMLTREMEFEDALQLLSATDAKAVFDKFKDSFTRQTAKPNEYHYAMLRSSADHVWTSNYDTLFESANQEGHFGRLVVPNDNVLMNNFRNRRSVIKMNGDFETAVWNVDLNWDLVFLREQFDTVEYKRAEIWRAFEDDYRNRCMIFVGLSFTDSALRRIVSVQRRKIPRTHHQHYFLIRKPRDPLAERKASLHAADLERLNIRTLFMESHDDVAHFVKRVALLSVQPVVAVSGTVKFRARGGHDFDRNERLPNGAIDGAAIETFCSTLGCELASSKSFRVTSGGGPGVGIPAVSAAFEANPSLARFYLRRRSSAGFVARSAPAIIIPADHYSEMRKRLIGEAHLLVALGGEVDKPSGTLEEIDMALQAGVPVLLVPQAGGGVYDLSTNFRQKIAESYRDDSLRTALYKANERIASVPADQLLNFARSELPNLMEDILLQYIGSRSTYKPGPSRW